MSFAGREEPALTPPPELRRAMKAKIAVRFRLAQNVIEKEIRN
jgi:hypothetical protein